MPAVCCPCRFFLLGTLLGAGLLLAGGVPVRGQEARAAAAKPDDLEAQLSFVRSGHQLAEALQACQQALRQRQAAAAAKPDDLEVQLSFVRSRHQLAEAQIRLLLVGPSKETLDGTDALLLQLLAQHPDDAALRFELARVHQLRADLAAGVMRADEAVAAFEAELKILRQLAAEKPRSPEYREQIVKALTGCSRQVAELARYRQSVACLDEALRMGRQLVAECPDKPQLVDKLALACHTYAFVLRGEGEYARGAELVREALGLLAPLEKRYPDKPEYWYSLPTVWLNFAQPDTYHISAAEAESARHEVERLQAKLEKLPDAAKKWLTDDDRLCDLFLVNKDSSRLAANPGLVEGLVKVRRQQAQEHPEVPLLQAQLGTLQAVLAEQLFTRGATEAALAQLSQGMQVGEKLAAQFPQVPKYRLVYAKSCGAIALAYQRCGRADEAERLHRQAIAAAERLAADFPAIVGLRLQTLTLRLQAALAQPDAGTAARHLALVLEAQRQLVREYPDCPGYRDAAQTACLLARVLDRQGDDAQAEAAYREGIRLSRQAAADFPRSPQFSLGACMALSSLAVFQQRKQHYAEAEAAFAEMIAISQGLAQQFPDQYECRCAPGDACGALAMSLDSRRQDAAALQKYSEAIACTESVLKANPRRRDSLQFLRRLLNCRADVYLRQGRQEDYEADRRRAEGLDERLKPAVVRLLGVERSLTEGKRPEALQEAEDLFAGGDLSAAEWAELARLYALAAATQGAPDAEKCAAHAVEALGHAIGQGYAFAGPLGQDVRFRGLADRADFRKLAAEHAGR
jgi:tetratricopeptide (TPR) repeat protein